MAIYVSADCMLEIEPFCLLCLFTRARDNINFKKNPSPDKITFELKHICRKNSGRFLQQ